MKKKILLLGAGKSSTVLIEYLNALCLVDNHEILVISDEKTDFIGTCENNDFFSFTKANVADNDKMEDWVKNSDLVLSMLPASLHLGIAKQCLHHNKHFISASYVSDEMRALHDVASEKSLIFLNECGLDPGLDHMSAMKIIDGIKEKGGNITGFESFAGGLIAPDSDDNPWNYKLTWNPRNVVLAGQGGIAKFKQSGTYKYIPYQQLFKRTELITIPNYGRFEGYANRDSLKYKDIYNLNEIDTLFRGTLRRVGFCKAWNKLVELGMTDDSYVIKKTKGMTYRSFTNHFLAYHPTNSVEVKFNRALNISQDDFHVVEKMEYLGLFTNTKIEVNEGSPAVILQEILEKKWKLKTEDKDMIVMWHKFNYKLNDEPFEINSSLVVEGTTHARTAMAKTVGLPLGIAAKLVLQGKIKGTGVMIPITKELYNPILEEMERDFGMKFSEVSD